MRPRSSSFVAFCLLAAGTFAACSEPTPTGPDSVSPRSTATHRSPPAPAGVIAAPSARLAAVDVAWETVVASPPVPEYLVGYAHDPIPDGDLTGIPSVTVEAAEGQATQCVTLEDLDPGQNVYVRVLAQDLDGELSPLSEEQTAEATASFDVAAALVDWGGPQPARLLPGIEVRVHAEGLCSAVAETTTTDVGGRFALTGLPAIESTTLEIHDPTDRYHDMRIAAKSFGFAYPSWYVLMLARGGFVRSTYGADGRVETWSNYRWFQKEAAFTLRDPLPNNPPYPRYTWTKPLLSVYAAEHVNANGVDLRKAVEFTVAAWNVYLDDAFFAMTLDRDQADILVTYDVVDALGRTTMHPTDALTGKVPPDSARVQIRENASNDAVAQEIFMHEFGHVLQLSHSGDNYVDELMTVNPADRFPEPHEAWAARMLLHMPPGSSRDWYVE